MYVYRMVVYLLCYLFHTIGPLSLFVEGDRRQLMRLILEW